MVPNDSPIKTHGRPQGQDLPWGYQAQTTGRTLQLAVLANAGLTMDDVRPIPTQSLFSGVDLLGEGKVDAATIAVGTAQVQRANVSLASRGGIRFLNVDESPEAVARQRKVLPSRVITLQPAPHNVGIVGPTKIIAYSIFFTTHPRCPTISSTDIAKTHSCGRDDMLKQHPCSAASSRTA
jgi:hypothetical protein